MFDQEAPRFLADLAANNSREWFQSNKGRYEDAVKRPGEAFAEQLAIELSGIVQVDLVPKIFRIHRDVRFSKDKTPYNTHWRVAFAPLDAPEDFPLLMFGLEQERAVLGLGLFAFSKAKLESFREQIAGKDGDRLASILDRHRKAGGRVSEPDLKRVPPPFPADHGHADLLRHKGLTIWFDCQDHNPAFGEEGPRQCARLFEPMLPVFEFLRKGN